MTDARTNEYLAEVLPLDPARHATTIFARREAFRNAESSAAKSNTSREQHAKRPARSTKKSSATATRDELEVAIDQLRAAFYELEPAQVRARLAALQLGDHPDLERVRRKLLEVNDAREELDELAEQPKCDRLLLDALRRVLIAPASEAATLRERIARSAGNTSRAKEAKAFAKLVSARAPRLTELEGEWLERLRVAKRDRKDSRMAKGGIGCFSVWVIYRVIVEIVRYISD